MGRESVHVCIFGSFMIFKKYPLSQICESSYLQNAHRHLLKTIYQQYFIAVYVFIAKLY